MARRASRSMNPVWVGVAILMVAAIVGTSFFLFGQQKGAAFRTVQPLVMRDYFENANSLRGNTYKIEGTIQSSLFSSVDGGRLITINVESSQGTDLVPVILPPELNKVEIQRGNRVVVKVSVEADGFLKVEQLDRI